MNIAVVDDLPEDRNHLLSDLEQYGSENAFLLHLESYESGEEFFQRANPVMQDAVFLDIYMGGISGIEAAYRIKQLCPTCQIIFITATPEFAIESYAVRAFHYILNPYRYENISDVMNPPDRNRNDRGWR